MLLRLLLGLLPFLFFAQTDGGGGSAGGESEDDGDDQHDGDDANRDGDDDDDTKGLKSALDKERANRKAAQKEARDLRKRVADLENAGKPETEQQAQALKDAQDRADKAEQRLREATARSAVTEAATKANAISARAIYKLIEDDLEFDDDGEPTNVDALIEQAKQDEPKLFRYAAGSGDGGKRSAGGDDVKPGMDRLRHAYETESKTAKRR